jgi:arylsulfatase A-like enzyme
MSLPRRIMAAAGIGFLVGATTALIEIGLRLLTAGPGAIISPRFFFPSMVIYGIVWSMGAVLLALLMALVRQVRRRRRSPEQAGTIPILLAVIGSVTVYLIGGGYVNSKFFPSYLDLESLLFDAVFAVVVLLLGFFIYRKIRRAGPGLATLFRVWAILLVVAFAGGLAFTVTGGDRRHEEKDSLSAPSGAPNVLVLLIDTLRSDHLSCYGYGRRTSPNMDQAAAGGVLFLETYSQASWTKPATASLMTGVYPSTHQTTTMGSGLMDSFRILPEVYSDHGYRTAILTSNNLVSPLFGFDQGVDFFYYGKSQMVRELMLGNIIRTLLRSNQKRKQKVEDYFWRVESFLRFSERVDYDPSADALNARFLEWYEEDPDRPFFAYIHYIEPHYPYTPPAPFDTMFSKIEPGAYVQPTQNYGFQPFDEMGSVDNGLLETVIGEYDGEIAYLDDCFGRFFSELSERGIFDNTILVITSDHGEEFFDHAMWGHGHSLFNEVVRIPLIIRFPPEVPAGTEVTALASLVDVFPTLLDLSGIEDSVDVAGHSLVPLMHAGGGETTASESYGEVLKGGRRAWFLTDGKYKLLRYQKGVLERTMLFELDDDGTEHSDLVDSLPGVADSLLERMEAIYRKSSSNAVEGNQRRIDKATEDQLRALGYIY